jgi:Tfp pilus assembly protein PilW
MRGIRDSAGLSLLEIIVSMMILAAALVGLINVFVMSNALLAHSRARVSASQLGTVFLEPLHSDVRLTDWNLSSNNLTVQTDVVKSPVAVNNIDITPKYTVADDPSGSTIRRVSLNLTWNETRY